MHIAKFTRQQSGHILQHYDRSKECPSADPTKKDLNYNLAEDIQPMKQQEFIQKRLSELQTSKKIRKDAIAVCDWIVTAPKDLPKEKEKEFFQAAYDKLKDQYGEKNIISAWVHRDEAGASHMHFAFVPITKDKKKGIDKLCAKEVVTLKSLKNMHPDMEKFVSQKLGFAVHILTGELSDRPDLSLPQYKSLKEFEKKIIECEKVLSEMMAKIDSYKNTFDRIKSIESLEPRQGRFGIKDITMEDIRELQKQASHAVAMESDIVKLTKEIQKLEKLIPSFDEVQERIKLTGEIERLQASNKALQDTLKKIGYSDKQIEKLSQNIEYSFGRSGAEEFVK